jgi:2-deoxy-D-gluconate 3-dehydrogenase
VTTPDSFRLDGRVAAITGTTRGIGRAIALALAAAGADIVHIDRSDPSETMTGVLRLGRHSDVVHLDLEQGDGRECDRAVAAAAAIHGRIDVLVNSAGIVGRGPFLSADPEELERVIRVDLLAPMHLCRSAGARMLAAGGGKIINIASLMSFQGGVDVAAYASAKHGLAGLTKALANEWGNTGVCVNAIAPGYIETEINSDLRRDATRTASLLARIPQGRFGLPEDLTGAALFLASSASDYVTGTLVAVDGGWLSR